MALSIDRIDHVVLNCRDVEATVAWYQRVLGMECEEFGDYRHTALKFGRQKFNVRPTGKKDCSTTDSGCCLVMKQRRAASRSPTDRRSRPAPGADDLRLFP